jgi:hypothetical protein
MQMANKYMKKMFNVITHYGKASRGPARRCYMPISTAETTNSGNIDDTENLGFFHTAGENTHWYTLDKGLAPPSSK